jgi:hypothetical protein
MRAAIASAVALVLIATSAVLSTQIGTVPVPNPTSSFPPANPVDGQVAARSDGTIFVYLDSLTHWYGPEVQSPFDRAAAGVADFLRFGGGQGVKSDTLTADERRRGFYAYGTMRLFKAHSMASSNTVVNCTTRVWYDDGVSIVDLVWDGSRNFWTPAAVVLPAGETASVELIAAAAPVNPDNPTMMFIWREEVDP